jgi:hypothetical protein
MSVTVWMKKFGSAETVGTKVGAGRSGAHCFVDYIGGLAW